jgi:hypothetical protein
MPWNLSLVRSRTRLLAGRTKQLAAYSKNEIPKMADGDRRQDSGLLSLIQEAETKRDVANAPYSCVFHAKTK